MVNTIPIPEEALSEDAFEMLVEHCHSQANRNS